MKWITWCSILAAFLGWVLIRSGTNNVCKTFKDYYSNRDNNKNCYYNPDGELQVPDIIRRHGYPLETHQVLTDDGYILTLFRIPHGKLLAKKFGKPILINHGATLNAGAFVNTGKKSLAFILADAGYDVWLGNFRGSKYSRKHSRLNDTDSQFWEFSFHELGLYDVPAQINFINKITNQQVIYIGYSKGATAAYVYGSSYPVKSKEKVKIFIGLAPGITFQEVNLPWKILSKIWPFIKVFLQVLFQGRLCPQQPLPNWLHEFLCLPFPFQTKMCQIPEMLLLGFSYVHKDPETLPATFLHNVDLISIKTLTHYFQLIQTTNFDYFDYGAEENLKIYGTVNPPQYNLSNVMVPSYLVAAKNDPAVSEKNVEKLYATLPAETTHYGIYTVEPEDFNHVDFLSGKDVVPLLYDHLVAFINKL